MKQVHEITYNGITYKDKDTIKFKWGLDNSFTFVGQIKAISDTLHFIATTETGAIIIGKLENVISKVYNVKTKEHDKNFNYSNFLLESIKDNLV